MVWVLRCLPTTKREGLTLKYGVSASFKTRFGCFSGSQPIGGVGLSFSFGLTHSSLNSFGFGHKFTAISSGRHQRRLTISEL